MLGTLMAWLRVEKQDAHGRVRIRRVCKAASLNEISQMSYRGGLGSDRVLMEGKERQTSA